MTVISSRDSDGAVTEAISPRSSPRNLRAPMRTCASGCSRPWGSRRSGIEVRPSVLTTYALSLMAGTRLAKRAEGRLLAHVCRRDRRAAGRLLRWIERSRLRPLASALDALLVRSSALGWMQGGRPFGGEMTLTSRSTRDGSARRCWTAAEGAFTLDRHQRRPSGAARSAHQHPKAPGRQGRVAASPAGRVTGAASPTRVRPPKRCAIRSLIARKAAAE